MLCVRQSSARGKLTLHEQLVAEEELLVFIVCLLQRKLISYEEDQDWQLNAEQEKEEQEQEEVDQSEMADGASGSEHGRVRLSVLRDLGLKQTGDEMDTISRNPSHSYYLRSLERPEQQVSLPPFVLSQGSTTEVTFNLSGGARPVTTDCPYALPTLSLPAPPTPKGRSAGDFYEALNARDQEIRKGQCIRKA